MVTGCVTILVKTMIAKRMNVSIAKVDIGSSVWAQADLSWNGPPDLLRSVLGLISCH